MGMHMITMVGRTIPCLPMETNPTNFSPSLQSSNLSPKPSPHQPLMAMAAAIFLSFSLL